MKQRDKRTSVVPMRLESGSPLERVEHYRCRASQLRVIAGEWADNGIREMLLRVAVNYEHMAERLEKQVQDARPDKNSVAPVLSAA